MGKEISLESDRPLSQEERQGWLKKLRASPSLSTNEKVENLKTLWDISLLDQRNTEGMREVLDTAKVLGKEVQNEFINLLFQEPLDLNSLG